MEAHRARPVPGESLLHPLALGAVALLLLNDHALKQLMPGAVTGKLSDVAGLIFFPLLLCAMSERLNRAVGRDDWQLPSAAYAGFFILTGLVFFVVKSSPTAAGLYSDGLGILQWPIRASVATLQAQPLPGINSIRVLADRTDLLALAALLGAWLVSQRTRRSRIATH